MQIEIVPATVDQKPVIRHLLELYLYDFSEFDGADVDSHGLYGYDHLDAYWVDEYRHPFLIRADGRWAGFALVMEMGGGDQAAFHWMAEFFVMRKYRRQGVGQQAACEVFDRFPGMWRVAQIRTNEPAQRFWRTTIGHYTEGMFEEIEMEQWKGPVQEFRSPPAHQV